jgi:hypothetical protein
VFVHTAAGRQALAISDWDDALLDCGTLLRLDSSTGGRIIEEPFDGVVRLDGYGVAVVTNAPNNPERENWQN